MDVENPEPQEVTLEETPAEQTPIVEENPEPTCTAPFDQEYFVDVPIDAPELVGLSAASLEDLAIIIAIELRFDTDVMITQIGDVAGQDAIGGEVTYEMTGLKDDSLDGYVVEPGFQVIRDQVQDGAVSGYTTLSVVSSPLCSRGVTEDGLCV